MHDTTTSDATLADEPAPSGPVRRAPVWASATVVFWGLVFAAFIGVWKASQEVGVATWWRGPRSTPQPVVVQVLPLVPATVMVIAGLFHWRRLGQLGLVAGLLTAAIGVGDLGRVTKLGVVEIALGVAGLVFSVAVLGATRAAER